MDSKVVVLTLGVVLSAGQVFAAGGEINGDIRQENTMSGAKVISLPDAGISLPIGPLNLTLEMDGRTRINTIENNKNGKIEADITQKSDVTDSVVVSSQINSVDNGGILSGDILYQESNIKSQSWVVGADVNRVTNK